MRILLLGANGFIGGYLLAHLRSRGHEVVAAVRHPERLAGVEAPPAMRVDLNRDTSPEAWMPRLAGIDAVVNCAGVLQGTRRDHIDAIHAAAPAALFEACERSGLMRVVQVSAVSADRAAGTEYATTKLAADERLRASPLAWTVVRPSLVYAPGAFGGTALLRALAAFPFFVPLPGDGEQRFQPVHIDDVCRVVAQALETQDLVGKTVDPVGPEVLTLREILGDLRRWLGLGAARFVEVPMALIRLAARAGDVLGSPMNSTAIRQLEYGNVSDADAFKRDTGIAPRPWRDALAAQPAQWQDRWHALLYFVRPLLRIAIALMWLASAIVGWMVLGPWAEILAVRTGLDPEHAYALLGAACLTDFAIALLVLARWRPGTLAAFQVALILGYTVALTAIQPALWLDPFGALLKNLVVIPAVLALAALEQDR